jgi:hypothetical protein
LIDDVRNKNITKSVKHDYRTLKEFMLSDERKKRLREMNVVKRIFAQTYWMIRALIIQLTPARRILLLIAILLLMINPNRSGDSSSFPLISVLLFLFIIMLELKDKLLAHRELQAGHGVQQALMPDPAPQMERWDIWLYGRSANEVGGDLIDFLKYDDNRFYVALGDVSGKGLSAALLSIKLQATLRALAGGSSSLEDLGKQLNNIFCRDCMPQMFSSLLYLEFNPLTDKFRVLNAGHFPALTIHNDSVVRMEKGAPALGLMNSIKFFEQELSIGENDLVLLYTDGITEAANEHGEFFGEDRLMKFLPKLHALPSKEAGEKLIAALDYFVGSTERADDVSIILMRRKKSSQSMSEPSTPQNCPC